MRLLLIPVLCMILFVPTLFLFSRVVNVDIAAGLAGICTFLFFPYWLLHAFSSKYRNNKIIRLKLLMIPILSLALFFPVHALFALVVKPLTATVLAGIFMYLYAPYWLTKVCLPKDITDRSSSEIQLMQAMADHQWVIYPYPVCRAARISVADDGEASEYPELLILDCGADNVVFICVETDTFPCVRAQLYLIYDTENQRYLSCQFDGNQIPVCRKIFSEYIELNAELPFEPISYDRQCYEKALSRFTGNA